MSDHAASNRRRAALLVSGYAAAAFAVPWALLAVLGAPVAGLVVGVVTAVAVGAAGWLAGDRVALRRTGALPADPVEHARLHNLAEGLAVATGVPKPRLFVVVDGALNCFAVGRDPRRATVVVTTGLLAGLDRVELEGVLAHELSHVKSRDTLLATVAVVLPGAARLLGAGREAVADLSGVSVTRYPPGLIAALEKLRSGTTIVATAPPSTAHLWIAPALARHSAHPPLEERIETLREL